MHECLIQYINSGMIKKHLKNFIFMSPSFPEFSCRMGTSIIA